MKQLIILLSLLFLSKLSDAQPTESKQSLGFEQIGWTFNAPLGFQLIDSATHINNPAPGIEFWIRQFVFQKDKNSLVLAISKSTQKGIDWNTIYKKEVKQFYDQTRMRQLTTTFDSASTTIMLDSQLFNRFSMTGRENGQVTYNHVQLSRIINGYRFNISYNFATKEAEDQIESILNAGRFVR